MTTIVVLSSSKVCTAARVPIRAILKSPKDRRPNHSRRKGRYGSRRPTDQLRYESCHWRSKGPLKKITFFLVPEQAPKVRLYQSRPPTCSLPESLGWEKRNHFRRRKSPQTTLLRFQVRGNRHAHFVSADLPKIHSLTQEPRERSTCRKNPSFSPQKSSSTKSTFHLRAPLARSTACTNPLGLCPTRRFAESAGAERGPSFHAKIVPV